MLQIGMLSINSFRRNEKQQNTMKINSLSDITIGMSEILKALGFGAMAKDVIGESDNERLTKYARVIIKNSPMEKRQHLFQLFNSQNLYPKL